ncbi:MAG: hypothetical protein Kow0098_08260 [Ignavibacteriaceae bacterium]
MGQTQLLLLTLGVILAALAVYSGLNQFVVTAADLNRDALLLDVTNVSADAQAYYKKPSEIGGGGYSYLGFETSSYFKKYENGKMKIRVNSVKEKVVITGTGTEIGWNGRSKVQVRSVVKPNSIVITLRN